MIDMKQVLYFAYSVQHKRNLSFYCQTFQTIAMVNPVFTLEFWFDEGWYVGRFA